MLDKYGAMAHQTNQRKRVLFIAFGNPCDKHLYSIAKYSSMLGLYICKLITNN
jgi:hypothetical protein